MHQTINFSTLSASGVKTLVERSVGDSPLRVGKKSARLHRFGRIFQYAWYGFLVQRDRCVAVVAQGSSIFPRADRAQNPNQARKHQLYLLALALTSQLWKSVVTKSPTSQHRRLVD